MGLGPLRSGMMQTEFRASLIRHQRPSLRGARGEAEAGCSSTPTPRQGPASPTLPHPRPSRGASYLCSCPTPATRKSPALENLRLLIKPT